MGKQLFANLARSTLASSITNVATSLTVVDSGSEYPEIVDGSGDWFLVTLASDLTPTATLEIVKVTSHAAGSTTLAGLVRAQEGYAASAFSSGAYVDFRKTAGSDARTEDRLNALEAALTTPDSPGTGLASGGSIAFISGLTFRVSAATYYINGTQYSSPQTDVTLDAADATNGRYDAIVFTTGNTVTKVTGTASANPFQPTIDPETQLASTYVLVQAAVSSIPVTLTNIYLENTEWTSSVSGGTFNAASTTSPFAGTKDVEATNAAANDFVRFTNGASISLADKKQLVFNIKSKAAWPNQKSLLATWYSGTTKVGQSATLSSGKFGFNSGTLGSYQQIVIPISAFAIPTGGVVDRLEFKVSGGGSTIGFHIDNVVLESNASVVTSPSIGVATPTTLGLVRVDQNVANPMTYLKETVDALLALKLSLTDWKPKIPFLIDGGGVVIAPGVKGDIELPEGGGVITGWAILPDQSGSIVIDCWKDTYANFPPDAADTIWGGSKPTLTAATKAQATGLNIPFSGGDILRFNVDSATAVTRATLSISYKRA